LPATIALIKATQESNQCCVFIKLINSSDSDIKVDN
jgi:hypothetical protein